MPSKKRKYNARFPAGRIKRIMQVDEEVGKIASAVPVIISRTLELFVESLLTKSSQITLSRNAKTLSPTHLKQCIMSESRFDFLKDLVKNVPDISVDESFNNDNNEIQQQQYHHHGQEQQQQQLAAVVPVPITYNGMESSSNGSSTITAAAAATRIYQRSQSFQPSTSSSSQQQQPQQQQYHNPTQQKQFYLNNYTSTTSSVSSSSNPNQNTKQLNPNMNNIEYRPPQKIVRINSTPSSTITSEQLHKQHKQSVSTLAKLEFPIQISYNIDGTSTSTTSSSSTESPTVKIDYSKLSLPATSPSIKIDLSNFSSQQVTSTHIQPSNSTLDEDYDV